MERTVIVLRGRQKSGKTDTIRRAWNLLRSLPGVMVGNREGVKTREIRPAWLDIDGHRVGFMSKSEPAKTLEEELHWLSKEKCVVIVCATHGKKFNSRDTDSEAAVKRFAEAEGWLLEPIDKICASDEAGQKAVNQRQAKEIVEKILSRIKRRRAC